MINSAGYERENSAKPEAPARPAEPYISPGSELGLSNLGQLELLRGTLERGAAFRTMVRGFSMTPFIRDGDIVTITSMNGREPRVGEMVAFTLPDTGRLAIHRIVMRLSGSWLLRGDSTPKADGVIPRENILGRVTDVERQGRPVRLGLGREGRLIAWLNRGRTLERLRTCWHFLHRSAAGILQLVQGSTAYGTVGRLLARRVEITGADSGDLKAACRRFNLLLSEKESQGPQVTNWVARSGGKVVGFVQMVRRPEDGSPWKGHWLFSLQVHVPYRGLGIGERLTGQVVARALEEGARDLFLAVFPDNMPAVRLYRKLGFEHITLPGLEPVLAAEKEPSGRRRIVMRKRLKSD